MATKNYSESMTQTRVLVDGLKNHKDNLPPGIDETTIATIEELKSKVEILNSEQEKLKANLKTKTEELEKSLKLLQEQYSNAKKRIKLDIPQSQWVEFGIYDKR